MAVCLTFDDGPDEVWTPRMLDALDRARARATFFVVGSRAARHPELVREIQARGHAVQPHCWEHDRTHREMTREEIAADLDQTLGVLRELGVARPTYWRPPDGVIQVPNTRAAASAHGLRLVLWHVDPQDWRVDREAPEMLEDLRRDQVWTARGNSIVVLHDGRINTPRRTAENTEALVEPLVAHVRSRGWRLGRVRTPPLVWRLRRAAGIN